MTINVEMLKQLLEEFEEKEAVCREELNVIGQQIVDLENRIVSSKEKLKTVAVDADKVTSMMSRYAGIPPSPMPSGAVPPPLPPPVPPPPLANAAAQSAGFDPAPLQVQAQMDPKPQPQAAPPPPPPAQEPAPAQASPFVDETTSSP